MQKRRLGRTGLMVPCIGMGAMGLISKEHRDIRDAERIVMTAIEKGMTFLDTARSYYDSEERLGLILGGKRKEVLLATKTLLRGKKGAMNDIETSLKKLRTDWIDLYQIHHIQYRYEYDQIKGKNGALEALYQAKKDGKIRFIGITSHHPALLKEILDDDLFDTIQIPVNPIEREGALDIIDKAKSLDLGIIAMKPLAGGNLVDVELALKFALSLDISVAIPGCTKVEHVLLDAKVGETFEKITEEEVFILEKAVENKNEKFCRRCRYCEPLCPQNIPIADIFRIEDYLILNATYARTEYRKLPINVTSCDKCGKCEEICPYELPIRERLVKAHERLTRGRFEDTIVTILRKWRIYDVVRALYFKMGGRVPER